MKPEPIYRQIGGIIRSLRRRADKPQEWLATQLGISRATLANIETGRQRILVHQLYAVAQALGVDVNEMLPTPPSQALASINWRALSFEGDLNAEQKQQVARLIDSVESPPASIPEVTNVKSARTRNTRSPSGKTAR